ncbi:hypothetical protein GE09DRAFT_595023 [Coniochaeta sp. 2T2.1]|nr:hypothetical protein GE09DRAFT_595023 [Coniochaeta sp. 2T2.1]
MEAGIPTVNKQHRPGKEYRRVCSSVAMAFFARDDGAAEQGPSLPRGMELASRQSTAAERSTSPRPNMAPSVAPSVKTSSTETNVVLDATNRRYKHEVTRYPLGYPRFAAMQDSRHTGGIYRRFGRLIARCQLYNEGRLDNLEQQLEDHDGDPTTDTRGLTARQTRRVGEPDVPDQLDLIMEEMNKEVPRYLELLRLDRDTQQLLSAYPQEVLALYNDGKSQCMLDESGLRPADHIDDFVYTRPRLYHNGIRPLLYSKYGDELFGRILAGRQLPSAGVARVLQTLLVLFVLFMILSPAGFIYLRETSAAVSYGLVVGFAVLFCFAFAAADTTFEHFLVGVCAYAAVLIGVLEQTRGAGGCMCS